MKNIIDALTDSYSLEGEFEVQKSIQFIEKLDDIELLKPYAIKLLQSDKAALRKDSDLPNLINIPIRNLDIICLFFQT